MFRYAVIGAGRQGTSAAYDLAVRGEAEHILLADASAGPARVAADRVNRLAGWKVASGVALDAGDVAAATSFLREVDAAVSAVPYGLNLGLSVASVEAGTHLCDLGGNTAVVNQQLALMDAAARAGVCLVPDCGEAPGMANNLMAAALSGLDSGDELVLYDGGIPQDPRPPWNFVLTFNMDGLTNEYDAPVPFVIDGKVEQVEPFDPAHYESIDLGPPVGTLEAFPAGTASTMPWTLGPRVRSLRCLVLRHPGHAAQFKAFRDAGLFSKDPIVAGGATVAPREVFHALIEPLLRPRDGDRDLVIARAIAKGTKDGRRAEATVDVRVEPDGTLGFTAMERATGWHAAIVCHRMASGRIDPGAAPVELAVDPADMLVDLRARGFEVDERVATETEP